jgi:hypothetical protein
LLVCLGECLHRRRNVQVLCVPTEESGEVLCADCGKQYKLYFARPSREERDKAIALVLQALAAHHELEEGCGCHPQRPFNVPAWSGKPEMSAAALLGGAPLPLKCA